MRADNTHHLTEAARRRDHAYTIGEKLRSDSVEIKAALLRQGRYTTIAENMRVKEVKVSPDFRSS